MNKAHTDQPPPPKKNNKNKTIYWYNDNMMT